MGNIEKARKAQRLSRRALGDAVGCHRNTIMRIEAGEVPKLEVAISIARFFKRQVEDIWYCPTSPDGQP